MKKIVVTGHTKGIGKAIFDYFKLKEYDVVGFSRSTGYDISNPAHRQLIVSELENADIFVNNAYVNFDNSQLELLTMAFNKWRPDPSKLIINISSRAAGAMDNEYAASKEQLDQFCKSKLYNNPPIINIKPGLADTDRVKRISGPRMTTSQLIEVLDFALTSSVKIQSITFSV
jgi:NAD(P)-dependent dehydrogenase (short-subunit alcohol dehydrogenase family)